MRILHISKFYPPEVGGIETFVGDLSQELSESIECDVLCANKENRTIIEKREKVKIIRTASLKEIFSTPISPSMISWLRKISKYYDLIHLHLPNPMANLAYFLAGPKAKLLVHWHSDIVRQKKLLSFYEPLQDWLLKKADKIIATSSDYLRGSEYLLKYKDKCKIIPLGLNPARLVADRKKELRIKEKFPDKPIIFSIGRLIYYKGFEYLIKAAKQVDGYFLLAGEGEMKVKLEKLIEKLDLKNRVFLLGRLQEEELGNYYNVCDVFSMPSVEKSEAFGVAQLEAMYFGKPIVSTNISGSGVSFVNQDNITGFVVPPRDSNSLAEALNKILRNEKLREKFSKNAKERFENNFCIKTVAEEILKLYRETVESKKLTTGLSLKTEHIHNDSFNVEKKKVSLFRNSDSEIIDAYARKLSRKTIFKESKGRILFLTYRLPNPQMKDGYAIRVLGIAKILSQCYRVDLASVCSNPFDLWRQKDLGIFFNNIILFPKGKFSFLAGAVKGFSGSDSIQEYAYFSSSMQKWVDKHYRDYILVFCNTLRTARYAENLETKKVIDLIESLELKYSSAKEYVSFFWKAVYDAEIPRLSKREQEVLSSFNRVFISSGSDKKFLEKKRENREKKEKLLVISNGVKEGLLAVKRHPVEKDWISFFGKMDYQPNEDAVLWFAKEVFPLVKKIRKEAVFYIIGANPTRRVRNLGNLEGVMVTEFLEDPYEIIRISKIVVVPLRFGAGVQNKILESMALGKAVLTSVVGARGTEATKSGKHFEVVSSFDSCIWRDKIIELWTNRKRRKEIGEQARELIEENYTWKKIGKKLLRVIEELTAISVTKMKNE